MTLPSVAEANANAAPDLGVLFVHGIGHQIVGETLVQFGDPLLSWLIKWLRDEAAERAGKKATQLTLDKQARLKLPEVTEALVKTEGSIPAHSYVEIGVTSDNNGQPKRWILAESCWAQAFVPPTFKALAYWGLVVYPWTNATHWGSRMRRHWSRARQTEGAFWRPIAIAKACVVNALWFILSVPISIIVLVLLALLLLLAIPPIPSLRAMLLRVQQALAGTVGDCYILVASPVQRAAIVSHVRRDIDWLISQDCKNIAIVAHSQGAAVAFEALRTGVLKRFYQVRGVESDSSASEFRKTLLITFGSGLAKLHELENAFVTDKVKLGWMPIAGLALVVLSLEFMKADLGVGVTCMSFGLIFWIVGAMIGAEERPQPNDYEPLKHFGCDTEWHDYFAWHDPVPNGPLFDSDQPCGFMKSEPVHNFASMWRDHTTYWLNRDQFVPAILRDLARLSQMPIFDLAPDDQTRIQTAGARRAARVQWLTRASSAIWVTAVVVIITRWSDLRHVGIILLSQLPLLEKAFHWFGINDIANGEFATNSLAQKLAGVVAVLVCATVAYQAVHLLWQIWTWRDTRALLQRKSYGMESPRWLFFIGTLAVVNAGIVISLGLPATNVARDPTGGWIESLVAPGLISGWIMVLWRLISNVFHYRTFMCTYFPAGVDLKSWTEVVPKFLFEPIFWRFWPAVVVALLLAPIMALSLTIKMDDSYRFIIRAGLVALGCFFIHCFGALIEKIMTADNVETEGAIDQ